MQLQRRFNQFVSQNSLATQNDLILVTVSGGKDSILLLHFFQKAGFQIGVAHCNFNLRGTESDEEEEFVRRKCDQLGIPFYRNSFFPEEYSKNNQVSIQMACRELRYAWFEQVAKQHGYSRIATAHHASDQVETLFINLLRGTGLEGLTGIPLKRGLFIRPMLWITDFEIRKAVEDYKLEYRNDSSNASRKYIRNQIRLDVVPLLKDLNPYLERTVSHTMAILSDISLFLKSQVQEWKSKHFIVEKNNFKIAIEDLMTLEPKNLWIFELFKEYNFSAATSQDVVKFLMHHEFKSSTGIRFESKTHVLFVDRTFVFLQEKSQQVLSENNLAYTVELENLDHGCVWGKDKFFFEECTVEQNRGVSNTLYQFQMDRDLLISPLELRSWKLGDKLKPLGMQGKHKKISDLFISKKIPNWQKAQIPILVNGDGEIIWVVGLQVSETFKITKHTKNVLTISYFCEYGESDNFY